MVCRNQYWKPSKQGYAKGGRPWKHRPQRWTAATPAHWKLTDPKAQQIRGFLQQAGIELKFPKPDHGLNAQFRLELAASYLNTFLLVEEKKARGARA